MDADRTWHDGDEVSVYNIGYGRCFPGVVTEVHPEDGAWVKTTTRPDGPSTSWYPSRYLTRSEAKAMQEGAL